MNMDTLDFARKFLTYLQSGDYEKIRACYQPDCKIWHNFDNHTQTVDENMALLERMLGAAKEIEYVINRLELIEDGYLQHHTLKMTAKSGKIYSTEACVIATLTNGKLSDIKEWIDTKPLLPIFTGEDAA